MTKDRLAALKAVCCTVISVSVVNGPAVGYWLLAENLAGFSKLCLHL